jgi:hypothetical protein
MGGKLVFPKKKEKVSSGWERWHSKCYIETEVYFLKHFFRPVLLWRSLGSCPKTTRLIIPTPLLDRLFQTLVFFYSKFPFWLMSRNFLSLVFCLQFFNRPVHLDTKMSSSLGLHVSRLGKHKNGEGKDLMFFFQKMFTHIVCSFSIPH